MLALLSWTVLAATLDLGDGVTLEVVEVPDGPAVGRTEVTNAQFRRFRAKHRSNRALRAHYVAADLDLDGDDHPAIVTHAEAVAFIDWLSERSGRRVRLPTEAEWERFARAGTTTAWSWGDDPAGARAHANLAGPATFTLLIRGDPAYPQDDLAAADDGHVGTAPVAKFAPNPWGLHDVHGNAAEWTSTRGPEPGAFVHRGGSWTHGPGLSRSDATNFCFADQHYDVLGFRVVVDPRPSDD